MLRSPIRVCVLDCGGRGNTALISIYGLVVMFPRCVWWGVGLVVVDDSRWRQVLRWFRWPDGRQHFDQLWVIGDCRQVCAGLDDVVCVDVCTY